MAVLLASSRVLDGRGPDPGLDVILFHLALYYTWAVLTPPLFWASRRFSIERENWAARVPLLVGLAVVVAVGVDLVEDLLLYYVAQPPWADHISFNPLESLFELDFLNEFIISLAVLSVGFARDFFLRYQERRAHAARLQTQLTRARLDALRMQLNPHFLFNTLHAISTLVEQDPKGVRRMVTRLSDLLRYALEERPSQEVPLRQELKFLEAYLDIQRIRFQDRLTIEQHAAQDALDALVPPLIMQPLVENAIKHGVSEVQGPGRITIRAWREGSVLYLSVADNGPGLPPGGDGMFEKGLGLRNTRARLEERYGPGAALSLRNGDGHGLVAEITLPYHTAADLRTTSIAPSD